MVGDRVFQSNYTAGLQILDASTIASGTMTQVAFFDTEPANDDHGASASTGGQWSNYPFFASGTVVASDIKNGLFVLAPRDGSAGLASVPAGPLTATVPTSGTATASLTVSNGAGQGALVYAAVLRNLSQPDGALAAARPAPRAEPSVEGADGSDAAGRPDPTAAASRPKRTAAETPGVAPLVGAGGPDAYGYRWADSNEPGGPAVDFQDLSGTGVELNVGDETYVDIDLPFAFPFYGADRATARVSPNGFLTFSSVTAAAYINPPIPRPDAPNAVVAAFWDDLDASDIGAVYAGSLPDGRFGVQWDGVARYGRAQPLTFQVLLSPDGRIEFQYGAMTDGLTSATVGIESPDGTDGLQVVRNAPYLSSDFAIAFTGPFVWARTGDGANGVIAEGASATVPVAFDAAGLPEGTYTAELVVTTSDEAASTTVVPVELTVGGGGGVSIVVDGPRGFRYLGPPSPGVTVDDLAAQNLVRGVPGYYPAAEPANLYTEYDTETGKWDESKGIGEVLALGRAFQWFFYDRNIGNPDVSRSRELPFTLATDRPANTADVELELDTDGNRFNFLANPFATDLDLTGITSWPGGDNLSPNAPVWTFDPVARAWVAAPGSVPAWTGFRVRAKGPRVNGVPRLLTIPASAGASAPVAARQAARPGLSFALSGTDADGIAIGDRAMTFAFSDDARAAFDADEDVEKFQTPATATRSSGPGTDGPSSATTAARSARPRSRWPSRPGGPRPRSRCRGRPRRSRPGSRWSWWTSRPAPRSTSGPGRATRSRPGRSRPTPTPPGPSTPTGPRRRTGSSCGSGRAWPRPGAGWPRSSWGPWRRTRRRAGPGCRTGSRRPGWSGCRSSTSGAGRSPCSSTVRCRRAGTRRAWAGASRPGCTWSGWRRLARSSRAGPSSSGSRRESGAGQRRSRLPFKPVLRPQIPPVILLEATVQSG